MPVPPPLPVIFVALALAGCGAAAQDSGDGDNGSVDTASTDCTGPQPTWQTWGAGFFASSCRTCHSVDTLERYGAPEGLDFDTAQQVRDNAARIRVAVLEQQSMPLGGGVPQDDLDTLDDFLRCGL